MKNDEEILDSLVAGGIIGAALGALITNSKSGSSLGALAGAALFATYAANEKARKTNIPLVLEENSVLYEVKSDGTKRVLRQLPKTTQKIPKRFTLK
jgi:hypothetical protein